MSRYEALSNLLGKEAVSRIRESKVLLVGAGGIGCELLKELVIAGFGEIHVIDLDTIDLSNLNRQFLFSRQHIRQSKAKVAAEVAGKFNKDVRIVPYVSNIITDPLFTFNWYRSFDVAFNALDNAEARRHVNKMCVAANLPLIDCGTAGFNGQVQVIVPRESECYDCRSHPAPKTFPVCTIRSTPSQPIHCVVWSKSFLFSLLFANQQEEDGSEEAQEGEDPEELQKLNKETNELADLKRSLREPDFIAKLVQKVFVADIERLLLASSLWKDTGITLPEPLQLNPNDIAPVDSSALEEHALWTPEQALGVLKFTTAQLISRLDSGESAIEFDKDDEPTLDFVVAATVLRSSIFKIPQRTKFQIKQMAGNIIPAVATTNAVVSGLGVLEALKIVGGSKNTQYLRNVNIFRDEKSAFISDKLQPPDPECVISNAARTVVRAHPSATLGELLKKIINEKLGYDEVSLICEKLIYDPDFDDRVDDSLDKLGVVGKMVTVVDEDDRRVNLDVFIESSDKASELDVEDVRIPLRQNVKRGRDDDKPEVDAAAPAKKQEVNNDSAATDDKPVEISDDGTILIE